MKGWSVWLIGLITVLYAGYWSWFSVGRHHTTNSTRFDLGNAEQVIWNSTQGRWFVFTDPYGLGQISRLAYHADFFLLALWPVYAAWPHAETLLIFQSLALAAAIPAVWLLARRWVKHAGWSVIMAGLFAITPGLHWLNAFDFHAIAMAVPLVLWSITAAVYRRYGWMLVLALLATLTKEEIGLTLLPLCAWLWWRARQRRWALTMLIPAAWSVIMLFWIIPQAQPADINPRNVYLSAFGATATEIVKNVITQPGQTVSSLFDAQTFQYGLQLLMPFGFFPAGHWLVFGGAPDGLINVISDKDAQQTIFFHYQAGILPWLVVATMGGLGWIQARWLRANWMRWAGWWLVICGFIGAWLYGPLPGAKLDYTRVVLWRNPYASTIREWSVRIPVSASVTVTNNVGAHFAKRQHLFSFPLGIERADYAVILEGHQLPEVATQAQVSAAAADLRLDSSWDVLVAQDELTILRRTR